MPLNESAAPENTGPSRRSVIRTAAWTVPAVSVAAATPAFAASGRQLRIQLTAPARWNNASSTSEYMSIALTVTNLSQNTDAGALSFYMRFSNVFFGPATLEMDFDTASGGSGGTSTGAYGAGWTKGSNNGDGLGTSRTGGATFTLSSLAAGQTSAVLGLRAKSARFAVIGVDPTSNRDPVNLQSITPPNGFAMATDSITSFIPVGP